MTTMVFGTDGWRDAIADGFTVVWLRRAARAYAQHLHDAGAGLVLVAHDTRFGGPLHRTAVAAMRRDVGLPVRSIERRDGVKLDVADDRWLMLRASGTEPVLRLYAEGPDDAAVADPLTAARAFVRGATQPNSR